MAAIPTTGPEALLYALQNLDVERLEKESRAELRSGRVSKRSKAINILNAVEGLKKNELKPDELMIHSVPVIPAKFRPFTVAGGTFIPGQANELYKDLIELRDSNGEELDIFGRNTSIGSRLSVYDAVRAAFGYGDPVKPKTKQRGASGLLKQVTGTTPKMGFFQKKVLSKPQDSVGRSTITVDPDLRLNEIGLPNEMAWTMYAPYVQRALVMKGFSKMDALRALKGRTKDAEMALDDVLEGTASQPARLAVASRSPAWHKFNVLAFKVRRMDGDNIAINPLVTTGYNADFNGDSVFPDSTFLFKYKGVIHCTTIEHFAENITGLNAEFMIKDAMHYTKIYVLNEGVETLSIDAEGHNSWMPVSQLSVHTSHGACYNVFTHTGKIVGATEHHNFVRLNDSLELETVKTEDLSASDMLPAAYNFGCDNKSILYIKDPEGKPMAVTKEIAWFLGFFIAEGSTGGGAVTICCTENEFFDRCLVTMKLLFNTTTKIQDTKLHKQCIIRDYRKKNIEWIESLCGRGFDKKYIPSCVWESPRDVKLAFIQGVIDGDGNIDDKGGHKKGHAGVRIELNNRPLVEQICGLAASIGLRTYTPRTDKAHMVRFCALDVEKLITDSWSGRKKDRLIAAIKKFGIGGAGRDNHDLVPVPRSIIDLFDKAALAIIHPTKDERAKIAAHRDLLPGKKARICDDFKRGNKYIGRRKALDYIWTFDYAIKDVPLYKKWKSIVYNTDVQWELINSIERTQRPDVTYDVTVPGSELFTVHGNLIVHNTMNIHVPSSDKAVQEAHDKLLPSKMLFSIKNPDKVVPEPKQEQVLGLYTATKRPATQTRYFDTEQEALDAIQRRELNLYDDVVVGEHYGIPPNPPEAQKIACIKMALSQAEEWEKTASELEIENALSPDLVDSDDYENSGMEDGEQLTGSLSAFTEDLLHATGDHPDGTEPQTLSVDELERLVGTWSELPMKERYRAEGEVVEATGRSVLELLGDLLAFKEASLRAQDSSVEDILDL